MGVALCRGHFRMTSTRIQKQEQSTRHQWSRCVSMNFCNCQKAPGKERASTDDGSMPMHALPAVHINAAGEERQRTRRTLSRPYQVREFTLWFVKRLFSQAGCSFSAAVGVQAWLDFPGHKESYACLQESMCAQK